MARFTCVLVLMSILESNSMLDNIWETQRQQINSKTSVSEVNRRGGVDEFEEHSIFRDRNGPLQFLKDFHMDKDSDWQYAINCDKNNKTKLNLRWKPKVIDPDGTLTVEIDMVAPVSLSNGTATVDVYVVGEEDPIFTIEQDFSCEDIKKMAPFINCPIQKGFPLKKQYNNTELTRLPVGNYILVVKVKNEKQEEFACLNGTVYLQPKVDMWP